MRSIRTMWSRGLTYPPAPRLLERLPFGSRVCDALQTGQVAPPQEARPDRSGPYIHKEFAIGEGSRCALLFACRKEAVGPTASPQVDKYTQRTWLSTYVFESNRLGIQHMELK